MSESTGTRVPRKQGVPPKISGSLMITDALSIPACRFQSNRATGPPPVIDHRGFRLFQRHEGILIKPLSALFPSTSFHRHGVRPFLR
jgi:hypothetical protein